MERIREEFTDYLYQTCLKATVKENRALTNADKQTVSNCYSRMAKSYRLIESIHKEEKGEAINVRRIF